MATGRDYRNIFINSFMTVFLFMIHLSQVFNLKTLICLRVQAPFHTAKPNDVMSC